MTTTDIALELEKLRGSMEKGFTQVEVRFAEMSGKFDRLSERGDRTVADVAALEVRMTTVERRIWMASGIAAFIGAGIPFLLQVTG